MNTAKFISLWMIIFVAMMATTIISAIILSEKNIEIPILIFNFCVSFITSGVYSIVDECN